jgi:excisionase family DNA binding protein
MIELAQLFYSGEVMDKLYRMGEAARLLDVHPNTIRRWEAEGKLRCEWTPGGKERRIPESEIRRILGITAEGNTDAVALYGRVSGHGQRDDLKTQVQCLEVEFAPRFTEAYTITDIGSGLNARRRGLHRLMDMARSRSVRAIAITYKDRLTRFGFEYLEAFFAAHDVEILVLYPDEGQTPEDELVSDMIALVTSFAGRLYGRRSRKTKEIVKCVRKRAAH